MRTVIIGSLLAALIALLAIDANNIILKVLGFIVAGLFFLSSSVMAWQVSRGSK